MVDFSRQKAYDFNMMTESAPKPTSGINEKAFRLFKYLQELVQLRTEAVRDALASSNYEKILWLRDLPQEKECYCNLWIAEAEAEDVWIEIKKPREPLCPQPPVICRCWVDPLTLKDRIRIPQLLPEITTAAPATQDSEEPQYVKLVLTEHPDVQDQWSKYLEGTWKPWAREHERWERVQSVYDTLYTMHARIKNFPEAYEVGLGIGFLQWNTPSNQRIQRHALTIRASISFDPTSGRLRLNAPVDDAAMQIEDDMLDPSERPGLELKKGLEQDLEGSGHDVRDKAALQSVLKAWVHSISPSSSFIDSLDYKSDPTTSPVMSFAPAVYLRKRSQRALLGAFRRVLENLQAGGKIPQSIRSMCEIYEGSGCYDGEPVAASATSVRAYLPLPANDEQLRIIDRLNRRNCVLVQGPPGTGKSHTISNLICHLLATGNRVLVTSQASRALKVLKNKIPDSMLPLCVNVLGNDVDSLKDLQDSVSAIITKLTDWDPESCKQTLSELEQKFTDGEKKLADVNARLAELREKDIRQYNVSDGMYKGTAQHIAQLVSADCTKYEWFQDRVDEDIPNPVSASDLRFIYDTSKDINDSMRDELGCHLVDISSIPTYEQFVELCETEKLLAQDSDSAPARDPALIAVLNEAGSEKRAIFCDSLVHLRAKIDGVTKRPMSWIRRAVDEVLSHKDMPWMELKASLARHMSDLKGYIDELHNTHVEIPAEIDHARLLADTHDRLQHLISGNGMGFLIFKPKVIRRTEYIRKQITVSGRPCESEDNLDKLLKWLQVEAKFSQIWRLWSPYTDKLIGPWAYQYGEIVELEEALDSVFAVHDELCRARKAAASIEHLPEPAWHDRAEIDSLLRSILHLDRKERADALGARMSGIRRTLEESIGRENNHPLNASLLEALENRATMLWTRCLSALTELTTQRDRYHRYEDLAQKVSQYIPTLSATLLDHNVAECWVERINDIEKAWNFKRAEAWLRRYESEHNEGSLYEARAAVSKKIVELRTELSSERAWSEFLKRVTEEQRQHLVAWSKAVTRIGKGTGKRAAKHRQDAQRRMECLKGAIPAWIMPFYRVADTISPQPEMFDVVIVDEASQCGPEAILLMYLAKKCIVVGDDQQISPDAVGILRAEVDTLAKSYLFDNPHPDALGLENSLFDQAAIRFGDRIVLREHFRCVPEIIRFSNDLCYRATPLIPLRQYPPQRLDPIVPQYVSTGYCEGEGNVTINPAEIDCIVNDIVNCCNDNKYDGKTMGVISLLGEKQAKLIEGNLLKRLGPEEMERRNIVCGDAYAFQGDERDVMFLSMVIAPNRRYQALTNEAAKRRFNVAASRARDQMRVYYSVPLTDLNPNCMRRRLLSHCVNPAVGEASDGFDYSACHSQFERDVAGMILARGYRVIPQYRIAGKQIDLMVEGLQSRLAVECDGDEWHGPEKYLEDMQRQRMLERCNLRFWRVRGTEYYINPDKALESLWNLLQQMDIQSLSHGVQRVAAAPEHPHETTMPTRTLGQDGRTAAVAPERPRERMPELGREHETVSSSTLDDDEEIRTKITMILQVSSKGKDLIADELIRMSSIRLRGRKRKKLKRRIERIVDELVAAGRLEEYHTDKRARVKLIS